MRGVWRLNSELIVQSVIVLIDLIVGLFIGYKISKDKTKKRNIIWGITTIFGIAPLLSLLLSFTIAYFVGDGWTGIAIMIVMFPLFFFVGVGRLFIGIKRK